MTIRSGGRARDIRRRIPPNGGPTTRPGSRTTSPSSTVPGPAAARNGGSNDWNNANRKRRGIPGILKFLVFALVLAAIVLGTLVTVMRPLVRSAIVGWADDNPAALGDAVRRGSRP